MTPIYPNNYPALLPHFRDVSGLHIKPLKVCKSVICCLFSGLELPSRFWVSGPSVPRSQAAGRKQGSPTLASTGLRRKIIPWKDKFKHSQEMVFPGNLLPAVFARGRDLYSPRVMDRTLQKSSAALQDGGEALCTFHDSLCGEKCKTQGKWLFPADAGSCCCQSQERLGSHIPVRCSVKQLLS